MHYHLIGICRTAMASPENIADNKFLNENSF